MAIRNFFVAGIGASAGGQEALKEFFSNLPLRPNIAFCVITHLLREHESVLDRILSKFTNLKVKRMKGMDIVEPSVVYVMPAGVKAYIKEGCIILKERPGEERINKTVDEFFYSLAEDQRERAIGIVFSGMGDDGARGVQLIHEFGGTVLVQEPHSTAFKSMPENAIKRDHPDQILPPAMLARNLMTYVSQKNVELRNY